MFGSTSVVGKKPHGRRWVDRLALRLFSSKPDPERQKELQEAVRKAQENHRMLTNVFGDCGC